MTRSLSTRTVTTIGALIVAMSLTACSATSDDAGTSQPAAGTTTAASSGDTGTGTTGDGAAPDTGTSTAGEGGSTEAGPGGEASPAQARDGQRIADIGAVFEALRDYFSTQQSTSGLEGLSYPPGPYSGLAAILVPEYLAALPVDPSRAGNYYYVVSEDGFSFALGTWLESSPGDTWVESAVVGESGSMDAPLAAAMGSPPNWGG